MSLATEEYKPPSAETVLFHLIRDGDVVERSGRRFLVTPLPDDLFDDMIAAAGASEDRENDDDDHCPAEEGLPEYHVCGAGDPDDAEDGDIGGEPDAVWQYECSPTFARHK